MLTSEMMLKVTVAFCRFLYKLPLGKTFTLRDLQNAVPTPESRTFATHLKIATDHGWIEPVPSKPDVYLRTNFGRLWSNYWLVMNDLKDWILHFLDHPKYQCMFP
jgi:hypothetical protein